METIKITAGETCKIDAGTYGINIEGPALIICIKEKDLEESRLQKTNEPAVFIFGDYDSERLSIIAEKLKHGLPIE